MAFFKIEAYGRNKMSRNPSGFTDPLNMQKLAKFPKRPKGV